MIEPSSLDDLRDEATLAFTGEVLEDRDTDSHWGIATMKVLEQERGETGRSFKLKYLRKDFPCNDSSSPDHQPNHCHASLGIGARWKVWGEVDASGLIIPVHGGLEFVSQKPPQQPYRFCGRVLSLEDRRGEPVRAIVEMQVLYSGSPGHLEFLAGDLVTLLLLPSAQYNGSERLRPGGLITVEARAAAGSELNCQLSPSTKFLLSLLILE